MSYALCSMCDGSGCIYCGDDDSVLYPTGPHADGDMPFQDTPDVCVWCDGDGCDECTPSLHQATSSSPSLHHTDDAANTTSSYDNNALPQQELLRTGSLQLHQSCIRPSFLDATEPTPIGLADLNQSIIFYVSSLSKQLYTTYDDAEALLRGYDWNIDRLLQDWVEPELGNLVVRKRLGLIDPADSKSTFDASQKQYRDDYWRNNPDGDSTVAPGDDDSHLVYCFSGWCAPVPASHTTILPCGHAVCQDCLEGIVAQSYNDGTQCIHISCPAMLAPTPDTTSFDKCRQPIPHRVIERILSAMDSTMPLRHDDTTQPHSGHSPNTNHIDSNNNTSGNDITKNNDGSGDGGDDDGQSFIQQPSRPPAGPVDTRYLFAFPSPLTSTGLEPHDGSRLQLFYQWLSDSYLRSLRHIRRCTNPDCPLLIFTPKVLFATLTMKTKPGAAFSSGTASTLPSFDHLCPCGHFTCILCDFSGGHHPSPCDLASTFGLQSGDRMTQELIASTTKSCPKCGVLISKDRFCNHVHCVKCNHHFCWICKEPWSMHTQAYRCTLVSSDVPSAKAREENKTLEAKTTQFQRFNLYYSFFLTYRKNMEDLLQYHYKVKDSPHFKQLPNLTISFQRLWTAYSTLSWSYGIASFLINNGRSKVVHDHQSLLIHHTEQVSLQLKEFDGDLSPLLDSHTYQSFHDGIARMTHSRDQFISSIMDLDILSDTKYDAITRNHLDSNSNASLITNVSSTGLVKTDGSSRGALSRTMSLTDETQESWACGLCSCLHIVPESQSYLFSDLQIEVKHHQLKEITRDNPSSITHKVTKTMTRLYDGLCQFRGIFRNAHDAIVCANCLACKKHGERDCRLCYPV